MDYAKGKGGYNCEVVLVLDRIRDPITIEVVNEWRAKVGKQLSIFEVNCESLSLSRNFGITKAKGRYVSILDGDDLYSESWLKNAIDDLEARRFDIAHPEFFIGFPFDAYMRKVEIDATSSIKIFESNQWPALLMASKEIFTKIPYVKDEGQFDYQDWLWNCETIHAGYRHGFVENTLIAIRQKLPEKSLWQKSFKGNKVVRPNALFKSLIRKSGRDDLENSKSIEKQIGSSQKILNYLNYRFPIFYESIKYYKRKIFKARSIYIEKWVKNEIDRLSHIEPEISKIKAFRTIHDNANVPLLCIENENIGRILNKKLKNLIFLSSPDDIKLCPMHATKDDSIAIISGRVDPKKCIINFDYISLERIRINHGNLVYLVLRVLMESKIDRLIIANSTFGNKLFIKYHEVINFEEAHVCLPTSNGTHQYRAINNDNIIIPMSHFDIFKNIYVHDRQLHRTIAEVYGVPKDKLILIES
jgi:hypothetical protein